MSLKYLYPEEVVHYVPAGLDSLSSSTEGAQFLPVSPACAIGSIISNKEAQQNYLPLKVAHGYQRNMQKQSVWEYINTYSYTL